MERRCGWERRISIFTKSIPIAMTIMEHIPASRIGPSGYLPYQVNPLADGRFALLGDPSFDPFTGYSFGSFGIWDRSSNSLTTYKPGAPSNSTCGRIAFQKVTPDRTKLMFGSNLSDSKICQFDTNGGQLRSITAQGGTRILIPADGKEFITYTGATRTTGIRAEPRREYTVRGQRRHCHRLGLESAPTTRMEFRSKISGL